MTDSELLERYADSRCEEAFTELVRRHINFVYSAALRQVAGLIGGLPRDLARLLRTARKRRHNLDFDAISSGKDGLTPA